MKYISLFAGIGGFDLALNRLGHECVYTNEWDKYAAKIYEKNFKHKPDTRDIRTVDASEITNHDLLVGGFPCQSFSLAGKRRGFEDTRGTLFFEICRILRIKRPAYFLLENVKGLLSHHAGQTFSTIIRSIDELGYDCQWQVLNSKYFGVPQNRERVFIVGHFRGQPRPKVFPIKNSSQENNRQIGEAKSEGKRIRRPYISATIDANYHKGPGSTRQFIGSQAPVVPTIRASDYKRGDNQTFIISRSRRTGNKNKGGTGPLKSFKHSFAVDRQPHFVDAVRRLTPKECERLQGFPDGWTEGISDTQRYKCLGNAVTVNVVEELMKRFIL